MVARLAVGDATSGSWADPYDVSVQAVSKHIKVLTDAGLGAKARTATAGRAISKRRFSTS